MMSLSKRELRSHSGYEVDLNRLGQVLQERIPEIDFALVFGSGRDGKVPAGGDLDLAVSVQGEFSLPLVTRILDAVQEVAPMAEVDLGRFDDADPVYRFEALKGRLLFARDMDRYAAAFSLACREYETQMEHYRRQLKYREEYRGTTS